MYMNIPHIGLLHDHFYCLTSQGVLWQLHASIFFSLSEITAILVLEYCVPTSLYVCEMYLLCYSGRCKLSETM